MVVVLPAPFGPSRPNSSPRPTEKLIPRTASTGRLRRGKTPVRTWKVRDRFCTSIIGSTFWLSRMAGRAAVAGASSC